MFSFSISVFTIRLDAKVSHNSGRWELLTGCDIDSSAPTRSNAEGIIETAKARGCDLIVMASHGRRGISKVLLGSQATKVVSLSPVPVLVCR
jgi:nucleotide-binding universal stress UspA family protein